MRLVLLHGFTGDPSTFDEVVRRLAPAEAPLALPLLGHGDGPDEVLGPDEVGFDEEVDRLARRMRDAGRGPYHVCGYSLGGRLALGLGARHPTLVARLTLIGVHPGLADAADRRTRIADDERWATLIEREGVAAFAARWQAQPLLATQSRLAPEVQAREHVRRISRRPDGLVRSLRRNGLGRMPELSGVLGRVATTLLVGEHDPKFRAIAESLARRHVVPVRVVPGAGHNLIIEAPDTVARVLEETP